MEKFGAVLGMAPGEVPVYSSDYGTADKKDFPDRRSYRSFVDGIFMGYKWQCVELARRWLYLNKRYIFDDIPMAYDIFRLRSVRVIRDGSRLPLHSFKNGARRRPEPGCLLIWNPVGEFAITGHVAIVTEVHDDCIRFVEQNVENKLWPAGQTFSRQLEARITRDGGYWIETRLDKVSLVGWVMQTEDATFAEEVAETDKAIFSPLMAVVGDTGQAGSAWVDTGDPAGAAYVAAYGHALVGSYRHAHSYICLSETAFAELKRATNEMHHLFMRATEHVLQDDQLLNRFNLPSALWPKIRESWKRRRNSMITGRFDFGISSKGLKVYEYNADSAACYFEAARLQNEWAAHFGCRVGRGSGDDIFTCLVRAWKAPGIKETLHIMQDEDAEETYYALFMKSTMEEAGLATKVLQGVAGLRWRQGRIVDPDGIPIQRVWKTWAWETAVDQVRNEIEERDIADIHPDYSSSPRLVDVLLRSDVLVHEPLWTLVPSNKAILPVMWMLFPDHPYLLNSQFELTDDLRKEGYVAKPIVGRCGENIAVVDAGESILRRTEGRFGDRERIYQSLFRLARQEQMNIQVCTFSIADEFAGACVRVDPSLIIKGGSDIMPLRIVPDNEYRKMQAATAE